MSGRKHERHLGQKQSDPKKNLSQFEISKRQLYLQDTLGLSLDPFGPPIAEIELESSFSTVSPDWQTIYDFLSPSFFEYYTPPNSDLPNGGSLLEALRQENTTFVFCRTGDGKTSVRLALEADCRTMLDGTLILPYALNSPSLPISLNDHYNQLAKLLAVSVFLQIVEQFNALNSQPTPAQVKALGRLIRVGGNALFRLVERIMIEEPADPLLGVSSFWGQAVKRPAVRHVRRSEALVNFLRECQKAAIFAASERKPDGQATFLEGWQTARTWGFKRLFILVDGVDTAERSDEDMTVLIQPLFDQQTFWLKESIFLKWFIPPALSQFVQRSWTKLEKSLPAQPKTEIMVSWDESSLRKLLIERFRAAKSRRKGLNDLTGPDLESQLETLVFRAANKSPRALLEIISKLFEEHAAKNPFEQQISQRDWLCVKKSLEEINPSDSSTIVT